MAGLQPGGQLTITTDVENYPGFAETIQGPWLMEQMQTQAEHVGTRVIYDMIVTVDLVAAPVRAASAIPGDIYVGRCAGHRHRRAGALARPAERRRNYQGAGVSACATCDGFFFRGKRWR